MSSGCCHPKNLLLVKPTSAGQAPPDSLVGHRFPGPSFRTKRPVWETKNPRADLFFLTRPLRPQLNSQLLYPNCTGCQQCFFCFFSSGVTSKSDSAKLVSFHGAPTAPDSPSHKEHLVKLTKTTVACNNFLEKCFADRMPPSLIPIAISKEQGRQQ